MSDRLALIIVNSEFDDKKLSKLRTPSNDAEALAEVLRDPAIGAFDDVDLLVNETGSSVRQKLGLLYHRRKKDDLLLLYYSGHGIKDEYSGELYLATQDTVMDLASATAIGAAFVRGQIDKSNSRRNVVVLDCCHSGAFAEGKAALGSSVGTQEAFGSSGYGRAILTASSALQFAWQGDKLMGEAETSVFTYYLVEGLRTGAADLNGNGQISIEELYEYTYRQVVANSKQTPQKLMSTMEGQIIIARNPHLVVKPGAKPAELPVELQQAIESPYAGLRAGVVNELERLLRGGDKRLALAAREALEHLKDDDSRQVSAAATQALAAVQADVPAKSPPMAPVIEKPGPELTLDVLTITTPIHLELVRVPAGEFLMGSDPAKDKNAYDDEQPQHRVQVSEFYIGKTPLTNAQYAVFVKATKRKAPKHWKKSKIPAGKENHPVVWVSWHDAVAFCEWLSRETGKSFRLPTEAEWEKAARGTDGRIYPWGNVCDIKRCNTDEGGIGTTTPVGQYSPDGGSLYGCADMAGNVWEWTSSLYKNYPYDPADGRENMKVGGGRVLRGGSFYNLGRSARSVRRRRLNSNVRFSIYGVRVGVGTAAPFSPFSEI